MIPDIKFQARINYNAGSWVEVAIGAQDKFGNWWGEYFAASSYDCQMLFDDAYARLALVVHTANASPNARWFSFR